MGSFNNFEKDIEILIAEDIFEIRSLILSMFHEAGFSNVAEAWSKINCSYNSGEPFDLIISDWNMPELCGLQLLKKLRGQSA